LADEYRQVLDIDHSVAPDHGPDVTEGVIGTPVVDEHHQVNEACDPIAVEVYDGRDGNLPEVLLVESA